MDPFSGVSWKLFVSESFLTESGCEHAITVLYLGSGRALIPRGPHLSLSVQLPLYNFPAEKF